MGLEAATLAVIGAATSSAGAVGSYVQGEKQAKAQGKAQDVQQAQQELQARRERLKTIREARIKTAQVEAAGANTGVASSSGVMGGVGSIASQTGSNLQNQQAQLDLAQQGSKYNQKAADAGSTGALFGTIGSIGQSVFQDYGGYKTIFGGDKG